MFISPAYAQAAGAAPQSGMAGFLGLAPLFLMCDVRDLGSWLGDAAPPDPSREAPRGPRVLTTERTRARLLAAE